MQRCHQSAGAAGPFHQYGPIPVLRTGGWRHSRWAAAAACCQRWNNDPSSRSHSIRQCHTNLITGVCLCVFFLDRQKPQYSNSVLKLPHSQWQHINSTPVIINWWPAGRIWPPELSEVDRGWIPKSTSNKNLRQKCDFNFTPSCLSRKMSDSLIPKSTDTDIGLKAKNQVSLSLQKYFKGHTIRAKARHKVINFSKFLLTLHNYANTGWPILSDIPIYIYFTH